MSNYKLTIENHPSQMRHPITQEPLFDKDGKPVPLFPDQKSIRLDGRIIAYMILETKKVLWIMPKHKLGPIADEGLELAEAFFGKVEGEHSPPEMEETVDDDVDDEE